MAPPLPFVEFLDHLRQRGFAVGLQQHQDLARLCLQRSDEFARSPQLFLRSVIALLARNKEDIRELETLYGRYFAEALRDLNLDSPSLASGRDQGLIQRQVAEVPAPRSFPTRLRQAMTARPWLTAGLAAAVFALFFASGFLVQRLREQRTVPPETQTKAPAPTQPQSPPGTDATPGPPKPPELQELPQLPPARTELHKKEVLRIAWPLPAVLLLILSFRRRRADLQRWAKGYWRAARNTLGGYYEPKLDFEAVLAPALSRADLDDMATILGRSDDRPPSRQLDGERSVRATAAGGALPRLVFARQPTARTVLILCDVAVDMALWQRKTRALCEGLSRRGVPVVLRYFNGDATWVSAQPHGPRQPLEQVHKHDPEAALLVLSCGFMAQAPGRGLEPALWLQLLTRFRLRAWLNPIHDKRVWRAAFSHADFPLRVLPMTRKGMLAAAYELAQERERRRHIQQADASPERAATAADAERLRRLLCIWPDAPLEFAEVLRQSLCPDIPESALIEVWTSSDAASSHRLRWDLEHRARWYRELQQEDARYQSADELPKRKEERARRLLLRLLHAAKPQTDAQDARFLSWRLACALQQLYLHDPDEHNVKEALATLAELSQGPLWEDVADALDPLGVPMLPRPGKRASLPLSEPVRKQLQKQVVHLIRRSASGQVHVPSRRPEKGSAATPPPADLRRPSWLPRPGLRDLAPAVLLFGLCAFAAYKKGIGSERIENYEAYRIEIEADPTASRCNESSQLGLILRTSPETLGPDFTPHSVLLCEDPACARGAKTVQLTGFETRLRIDRPAQDRAYHLRSTLRNGSLAYSKQRLVPGYTPPAMAELVLRGRTRSGKPITERIPFQATDAAGCIYRGTLGDTLRLRAGAVAVHAEHPGYGVMDETVQLGPGDHKSFEVILVPLVPPGMVRIPAGSFLMGSNDGEPDEKPVHRVTLAEFFMDKTEVTVAAYRDCVRSNACTKPDTGGYCNYGETDKEDHPINCIDWIQANKYCKSQGKRLPTEAEWEYAARGTDQRKYPWGNNDPGSWICWNRNLDQGTCPVGKYSRDRSPFDVMDMGGSLWEWVNDYYSEKYNKPGDRTNCAIRGASWAGSIASFARAADRDRLAPASRNLELGFRCARTAE